MAALEAERFLEVEGEAEEASAAEAPAVNGAAEAADVKQPDLVMA